ncbi:GNAT family N-acetyltransferase [Rhizobium sp. CF142]|uniref:GNAT family N-acetyltransferase n=1 Tax=Rhizobium sp. CF142 TaxID=1144314 RepID=UPI00026EF816|nr:GNAT family N-acetyltransferase [Rhizobium sp. CF142]EJJ28125.1 putative acetyltransferase [Rhizobium sp. CF142]
MMITRSASQDDLPYIVDAYRLAFAFDEARTTNYVSMVGLEHFRVLEVDGLQAAVWALLPSGHWLGGKAVPAANIAHVAISPEHRGTGLAGVLLEAACKDAMRAGALIASLFASSRPVYRKAGFNLAGSEIIYEAETAQLYRVREEAASTRLDLEKVGVLRDIYDRSCRIDAGRLDRSDAHWNCLLDRSSSIPSAFVFGQNDGYVLLDTADPDCLVLRDYASLNGSASRQILKFLGSFSTVYPRVRWHGAPHDPLIFALPDKGWHLTHQEEFLLKLLDPAEALSRRGYACADMHFSLEIHGQDIEHLSVSIVDGIASVNQDRHAAMTVSIAAIQLPSLYTGFRSAAFLRHAGGLDGPDEAIMMLDRAFAGPAPWVGEHF